MPHDVFGHGVQPVVAGDQVVLPPQFTLQLGFLFRVKVGIFNQLIDIVVQVGVDQLQLRCAVLIKQRHRGSIFN